MNNTPSTETCAHAPCNVRHPPVMSIAAHIVGARLAAPRQTVAADILSASDLAQTLFRGKHRLQ